MCEETYDEECLNEEDNRVNNHISVNYNNDEQTFEVFTQPIRVDNKISHLYKDILSDNIIEERTYKLLANKIYDLFVKSIYYNKYKNPKKIDRNDLFKMFYYFKGLLLKENIFSSMEMFIGFAEFFQVNYEQLYNEITVLDKEALLKELNEKLNINKKIKTKKLF